MYCSRSMFTSLSMAEGAGAAVQPLHREVELRPQLLSPPGAGQLFKNSNVGHGPNIGHGPNVGHDG